MQLEELAHQADIGPPGELHVLNAVARTELGVEPSDLSTSLIGAERPATG